MLCKLRGQPIVAIEVKLESKEAPSGETQVAQVERLINEVEVIVQALAGIILEKRLTG